MSELSLDMRPENFGTTEYNSGMHARLICEPSRSQQGRVWLSSDPMGIADSGIHLLPEELRELRDHFNKLLYEEPDERPINERAVAAWSKFRRRKIPPLLFHFEFKRGATQGFIRRIKDE